MWFGLRAIFSAALLLAAVLFSGCGPTSQTNADEEKEPHFLEGRSRVNSMDFDGAIQSFENALIANPRSSAAHFELGWLYDERKKEPATAIYHYGRFLEAHSNGEKADRARIRITACKQELARTVTLAPVAQSLQREFDQLTEENRRLREENERWRAYFVRTPGLTNGPNPVAPSTETPRAVTQATSTEAKRAAVGPSAESASNPNKTNPAAGSSNMKTHTVKSGETPSAIARKYNIRLETLIAANPKLDPRRMHPGQTLNIPVN